MSSVDEKKPRRCARIGVGMEGRQDPAGAAELDVMPRSYIEPGQKSASSSSSSRSLPTIDSSLHVRCVDVESSCTDDKQFSWIYTTTLVVASPLLQHAGPLIELPTPVLHI